MSLSGFLGVAVLALALVSAECRLFNVTFTNSRGVYHVQSPGFPSHAPAYSNVMWEVSAPTNSKVVLSCSHISLLKRIGCSEGSLTIWDGISQFNLCSVLSSFEKESIGNKLFVQFRTGMFGVGRFRCRASVKQRDFMDETGIPDSSEHGQGVGTRSTSCPCGWTNKKRIVGGRETLINEYVFPVSIKYVTDKQGFCGGSIITRRHILTAAHCIHDITKPIQVVVGEHDFNSDFETNVTDIIPVRQIVKHERYNHDEMTNDIAILVLGRDIIFNNLVGPICLPNEPYDVLGQYLKVLGWGMTSTNGKFSNVLQKVDLKVVPLSDCAARYTNEIDLRNPKQICTFAHQRDSCQGDSGGPLVYHDSVINRYVQLALVSYGKDCASADPAVNINVYSYYDWIQEAVRKSNAPNAQTCEKI